MIAKLIRLCLERKLLPLLLTVFAVGWGLSVAPMELPGAPTRDPVPVDAIPDLGENQQIVFTEWPGRSPRDVEDQVTYPLTVALMGLPHVQTVRSTSNFGFSTVYVIFDEDMEFYEARARILEKLASLPSSTLPPGVEPALGPDATALGQVFWYALEGRDPQGHPTGGWDLHELRTLQDYYVRYRLLAADGVSEVASIGGFVQEYQVDVDPDALHAHGVTLSDVTRAVRQSNLDVGARTFEVNAVEYVVRGIGFLQGVDDLARTVVHVSDHTPILLADVAQITLGPAPRRGVLDKAGAEAVGGVVVVRHGANPLATIERVHAQIDALAPSLPRRAWVDVPAAGLETLEDFAQEHGFDAFHDGALNLPAWTSWAEDHPDDCPPWLTLSQVTVVPFYDRTELIHETVDTLSTALWQQILVTVIVVVALVLHLRSSLLISATLPLAVLLSFVAMKLAGVDANVVALSGIAIAIGTMVDVGIVLCENVLQRLQDADDDADTLEVVHSASVEVAGAVVTAVATTVVSFLPVFALQASEGKLFRPLAFTKTFALLAAIAVALTVIPPAAHTLFAWRRRATPWRLGWLRHVAVGAGVIVVLALDWEPLGIPAGRWRNLAFTACVIGGVLLLLRGFQALYPALLTRALRHKLAFLTLPLGLVSLGLCAWLGFSAVFGWLPDNRVTRRLAEAFPGLGEEFMPPLDEGSYLYMPTTMPHASIGEAKALLQQLDQALQSVPEVQDVVGKIGRVDSALDPAPVSMVETVVTLKPEYRTDADGTRVRQWRDEIETADDIWAALVEAGTLPGLTSAPKLQPIAARQVMLQSGMRAPMGVKVRAPDLETLEAACLEVERLLQDVEGIPPATVVADRVVGKPYVELVIDRDAIARYGLQVAQLQETIEVAVGGRPLTRTVEGRERYPVRVRYPRELRATPEALEAIYVPTPAGPQVPLGELARVRYARGPQMLKSEDTFLVGYVVFDKAGGEAEVEVVERARARLERAEREGEWARPEGVDYAFAGSFESQVRSERRLRVLLPLALAVILLILYLQFGRVSTAAFVFSGVAVAWAGGFVVLWLYGQPWFADVEVFGRNLRDVFGVGPVNLSVAIWVGFIALFGIACDDGVVMATYLDQSFADRATGTVDGVRAAVVAAGTRRVRACLMTTATTVLALLPVLSSSGRGADVMVPMAIPAFGGMCVELLTLFVVPVLYGAREEVRVRRAKRGGA